MDIENQLKRIEQQVFKHEQVVNETMEDFFGRKKKVIVFLSVGFLKKRAIVVQGIGNTLSTSWKNGINALRKAIKKQKVTPEWLKVDLVTSIQQLTLTEFYEEISKFPRGYYPKGIALDRMFNIAYLREEVEANIFLVGITEQKPQLSLENINLYRKKHQKLKYSLKAHHIKDIFTFTTIPVYSKDIDIDESDNLFEATSLEDFTEEQVMKRISRTANYIGKNISSEGRIYSGSYPAFDRGIQKMEVDEQTDILESLLEASIIIDDDNLKEKIALGIDYLFEEYDWDIEKWETINEVQRKLKLYLLLLKYQIMNKDVEIKYLQKFQEVLKVQLSVIKSVYLQKKDTKNESLPVQLDILLSLFKIYLITDDQQTYKLFRELFETVDVSNENLASESKWNILLIYLLETELKKEYVSLLKKNMKLILKDSFIRKNKNPEFLELLLMLQRVKKHFDQEDAIIKEIHLNEFSLKYLKDQERHVFTPSLAMYFQYPEKIINAYYNRSQLYKIDMISNAKNLKNLNKLYDVLSFLQFYKKEKQDVPLHELSEEKIVIGMVRNAEEPPEEAIQAALIVNAFEGFEFVYFSHQHLIKKIGKVYTGGHWRDVRVQTIEVLENMEDLLVPKNYQQFKLDSDLVKVYQELSSVEQLKQHMMPINKVSTKTEVFEKIQTLPSLTLQKNGRVYQYFMKTGQTYLIWDGEKTIQVTEDKLLEEIRLNPQEDIYMQQYVQSVTKLGIPFKIKIVIGKKEGRFEVLNKYFQLNNVDLFSYSAELSSSLLPLEEMIAAEYLEEKTVVLESINNIVKRVKKEVSFNKYNLPHVFEITLGIDVNQKIWIENLFSLSPLLWKKIDVQQLVFHEIIKNIKETNEILTNDEKGDKRPDTIGR